MHYRTADERDVVTLAEMRWEFQVEDNDCSPIVSKTEFVEVCSDFLRQGLIQKNWVYWIAELEREIVSHIFVQRVRGIPRPFWLNNAYGYVSNVYTKPAYRRQGIGSQLMQQVLNWARHQEIDVLIVSISEESITFYERAGFTAKNEWMECLVKNYPG
ncbi:MAG: GNAT family N-acetyltransferase [Drouetiella hepatica Uher 2000/2452]|jgi:GNAT superfamily N-acetyltransferase|uniref:GNAT family N-acetyltransferase n=1 Tax=Drouetiella hepatica Uher 2000/2452 TaxID=904376 RepID=A0A951UMW9_9CYAN|nr:GNAT family N-acetyltransferase [Drouetiella hepatica Uher 2000/2452]